MTARGTARYKRTVMNAMTQREVYRDKSGRFTSRLALWNGPPTPQHIVEQQHRDLIRRMGKRIRDAVAAPNQLLEHLRQAGKVVARDV